MQSAAQWVAAAKDLARAGKDAEAGALFEQGLERFPADARFANSAGNFHARARRDLRALALFERALALQPDLPEAATNAAIVLLRLGRPRAAGAVLAPLEGRNGGGAAFWVLRAEAAKGIGDHAGAAHYLHRAAAAEPGHAGAVRARARLSLERGENRAVAEYEDALAREPGDFALMEGYMLALHMAGRTSEALEFGHALAAHFPSWIEGQSALAELRWAAGDAGAYTAHLAAAAAAHPAPEVYLEWAALLAGTDRHGEAAEVLARARALWTRERRLTLALAVALGEAGEAAAADAILAEGDIGTPSPEWSLARARNDLRLGRVDAAAAALETLASADPGAVAAWSLLDLCWRLTGDARHGWLHGQPGLVRELAVPLDADRFEAIADTLEKLHHAAAMPLAQSVKGGTQTRGALFARVEPELAELKHALVAALEDYRAGLPPRDERHPLLGHRDAEWHIAESWSVRFSQSGRHAAHVHPRGLLSSACYIVVPPEVDDAAGPGWLELGTPPEGLAPGLGALHEIKPRVGHCALFPSTLFHGTRAIATGQRMTVAFDVTTLPG